MKKMAFVARHAPTPEQVALAAEAGYEIRPVGDRDAFSIDPSQFGIEEAVAVVHPAAALRLFAAGCTVAVFENANRAPEGAKPEFYARALHIYVP